MENNQGWDHNIDISSISSPNHQLKMDTTIYQPYWNIYLTSHVPSNLNVHDYLELVKLTFTQVSMAIPPSNIQTILLFTLPLPICINYVQLMQILEKEIDEMSKILLEIFDSLAMESNNVITSLSIVLNIHLKVDHKLFVMFEDFPIIDMVDIKAHMVERYVSFKCVVLKVQQIKLMAISMNFQCMECKSVFKHYLVEGLYSTPTKCKGNKKKECQSKSFGGLKDSIKSIFIQSAKVQETDSQGRVPRQIICQFRENLVGKIIAGQTLILSGILKTEPTEDRDHKAQGIFSPYLIINSIKQKANPNDKYNMPLISKMRNNKRIFFSFIKSFCPTIYGHEIVKAGLILGLIGGSSHSLSEQSTFRQSSHILLLGDPGLGKSQLLKFAVELLPHSVYVNATSVSSTGMTVTVNKDNNEQTLEAGALILADGGICAIDEFDKIKDTSCLLEVMEQQTISIAKAGIICQLKCRVGILGSGNPTKGSYKSEKSFKDNTKISNAILSRFDLIFLLLDKPNPDRDRKLSQHIMKIHNHNRKKSTTSNNSNKRTTTQYLSLADQYTHQVEEETQTYTLEEMKHYLVYVRSEIHPVLSMEAAEVLKGFYISLRENNPTSSFQITSRQLESLIRLSMARARIECRTQVTQMDAIEITNLMQESLFDSFEEMGYNINSLAQEVKKAKVAKPYGQLSLPKQKKLFIEQLASLTKTKDDNLWDWSQLVKVAKDLQLNVGDFHIFMERLNQEGTLLQKGPKKYSFENAFL